MRLLEDISANGYFWLPNAPDEKIYGTIKVSNGGEVLLELAGCFKGFENVHFPDLIGRIHGRTENHGNVLLIDAFNYPTAPFSNPFMSSKIGSSCCFLNVKFPLFESLEFDNFSFSVDNLSEWVGVNNITPSHDKKSQIINYSVNFKNNFVLYNCNDFKIELCQREPAKKEKDGIFLSNDYHISIKTKDKKNYKYFRDLIFKFTNFLSFAMDTPISITKVYTSYKTDDLPWESNVLYESLPYTHKHHRKINSQFLFKYSDIDKDSQYIIQNWFELYSKASSSISLYFAYRNDAFKFLESKYLSLAQSLETYHRSLFKSDEDIESNIKRINEVIENCPEEHKEWLESVLEYSHRMTFRQRLKKMIRPLKNIISPQCNSKNKERRVDEVVRAIIKNRDHFTHNGTISAESNSHDIAGICFFMEGIIQILILSNIGFTHEKIESLRSFDRIQEKLDRFPFKIRD
ncbi:ApeA N-terminal domain 1-containing protein [Marinobacterium stanieri]|uniref:Uncharacterized protein n=1 Tax=Marinobacterium stanieri TaxID=49186 RepID=A0A1N6XY92_9GAMM|nr:HEPN domain-containing protein [Marinobacterium stanieri]SIR07298.1 hypothetical protein SAMN05421647_11819 [Marinobacterium stanieri]